MKRNSIVVLYLIVIILLCGYIIYDRVTKEEPTICNCVDCTCKNAKDINANQEIKVMYYVSDYVKTNYHDGRVALTLYSTPNQDNLDYGFFTLTIAYQNELNNAVTGNYDIKDGKLRLTFKASDDIDHTFKNELGVDVEYTDMDSWRLYSMAYNAKEISIGNIKLYRVDK